MAGTPDRRASLLTTTDAMLADTVRASPALTRRVEELERCVRFVIAPRTRSGLRVQSLRGQMENIDLDEVRPDAGALATVVDTLTRDGLRVERVGRFAVTASGTAEQVAALLGVDLAVAALPRMRAPRATRLFAGTPLPPHASDLFVAPVASLTVAAGRLGSAFHDAVFLPRPLNFDVSPRAPEVAFHHLDADAVRRLLRVPDDPRGGHGVTIAIVDTGFHSAHPYYAASGFDLQPIDIPAAPDAHVDLHGHGTAMAWNVFAVAPACTVRGYKSDSPIDAIELASEQGADIISCSWGYNYEQSFPLLEAAIRDVIAQDGRTVLFAAGNGHYAWPGSMPEVISVGGVYADAHDALEASNYASGFASSLYPGRHVPDICGLCGLTPAAVYLPLPVPPGSEMEVQLAEPYPDGDTTRQDDGWVYASGTSSATPQVAGVAALMLQHARAQGRTLTCTQMRQRMQVTGQPVVRGHNAQGIAAAGHPNAAVGYGLVDAGGALAAV